MRFAACCLALAALSTGRLARAAGDDRLPPLPLTIAWAAPANCPTADDVERRVRQLLSGAPPAGTMVVADARIAPIADGRLELVLTTEVAEARGTKTVSARSCAALTEAAAVFLALAIDSAKDMAPPEEPTPIPTPVTTTPPAAPTETRRPSDHATPSSMTGEPLQIGGGVAGVLDVGTLPGPSVGLSANLHARLDRFRLGALGTFWNSQEPRFDAERGAGASVSMTTAGAFLCYLFPFRRFGLGGCGNVEATFAEATGWGVRRPMRARSIWPTLAAGPFAEMPLSKWLNLVGRVDLLFPVGAPDLALATDAGNVQLYDPSVFSVRWGLGVEIVLP